MYKIESADMVGISAGTKNFINYSNLKLLKQRAEGLITKSSALNIQFRKELAQLIKAKNGNSKSKELILNSFTKNIKFWSNQYILKYIPENDEFFFDLVNIGYSVVQKRIDKVCLKDLFQKEKLPKENTNKTWFTNNTNLWIRSYIKAEAAKIKKNYYNKDECSLNHVESSNNDRILCSLKKVDRINLVKKSNEQNPEKQIIEKSKKELINKNLLSFINLLSEKERNIIRLIYFDSKIEGNNSNKIKLISKKLNVSDKRIYFLHKSALKKLKKSFSSLKDINDLLQTGYEF